MKPKVCRECRLYERAQGFCGVTMRRGEERFRLVVLADEPCRWQVAKSTLAIVGGASVKDLLLAAGPIVSVTA